MKALIAGAGPGGLSVALALHVAGWDIEVLEKARASNEPGAGLQLSPNACRVLAELNLLDDIRQHAFMPECLEMRSGRQGRRIFAAALGEHCRQRWGQDYLHIQRGDLLHSLESACELRAPGSLLRGTALVNYRQDADGVKIECSDGRTRSADVLIGADGIHSRVREQMLGADDPRFTGNVAWRCVVPCSALRTPPPPSACIWTGRGRHAVTYRLRGGELANFVGVVEQRDWRSESWVEPGEKALALADFEGWHPTITGLIDSAKTHYRWALFDRPPLSRWSDGRVTLLGDACHPMLPFLAQGAAQSMEDAWVLARRLSRATDNAGADRQTIGQCLRDYFDERSPRSSRIQAESRANMKRFHLPAAAYLPLAIAARLRPGMIHARQDWIYGHDVVKLHRD